MSGQGGGVVVKEVEWSRKWSGQGVVKEEVEWSRRRLLSLSIMVGVQCTLTIRVQCVYPVHWKWVIKLSARRWSDQGLKVNVGESMW